MVCSFIHSFIVGCFWKRECFWGCACTVWYGFLVAGRDVWWILVCVLVPEIIVLVVAGLDGARDFEWYAMRFLPEVFWLGSVQYAISIGTRIYT